jgi:predicted Zn-dependent protease
VSSADAQLSRPHHENSIQLYRPQGAIPLLALEISARPEPNAFAHPGDTGSGKIPTIFLTEGLLRELQSEDELAFVLAHEMEHLDRNHFSPDLTAAMLTEAQLSHIQAVQQDWELEADQRALQTLARARFRTSAATTVLKRLSQLAVGAPAPSIRRHPHLGARILALTPLLQRSDIARLGFEPHYSPKDQWNN